MEEKQFATEGGEVAAAVVEPGRLVQIVLVLTNVFGKAAHRRVVHVAGEGIDDVQLLHIAVVVRVGEAQYVAVADVGLVGVGRHRPQLSVLVCVNAAVGGTVEQRQTFVERRRSTVPVARPLVAAPVLGVAVEEGIHAVENLAYCLQLPLTVVLAEQHTAEPVGADPRVPVHAGLLPPVVRFLGRLQDAALHLAADALEEQR